MTVDLKNLKEVKAALVGQKDALEVVTLFENSMDTSPVEAIHALLDAWAAPPADSDEGGAE